MRKFETFLLSNWRTLVILLGFAIWSSSALILCYLLGVRSETVIWFLWTLTAGAVTFVVSFLFAVFSRGLAWFSVGLSPAGIAVVAILLENLKTKEGMELGFLLSVFSSIIILSLAFWQLAWVMVRVIPWNKFVLRIIKELGDIKTEIKEAFARRPKADAGLSSGSKKHHLPAKGSLPRGTQDDFAGGKEKR